MIKRSVTLNLDEHPYFKPWIDPESKIKSYVLKEHIAPTQQSLYFSTPSISADGKWLWFMCTFPPGLVRTVGVVSLDPKEPYIKHFPQAQYRGHFEHAVCIAPPDEEPGLYMCMGVNLYKLKINGGMEKISTLPLDTARFTHYNFRPSCMLSLSSDHKYFLLTGILKDCNFIVLIEKDTGNSRVIKELPCTATYSYFSPKNPELFFVTAHGRSKNCRLWLMDIEGKIDIPVSIQNADNNLWRTNHDFWSSDGWLCWVNYEQGAFEWNPSTDEYHHVWKRPSTHVHCSENRRYWCGDINTYSWDKKDVKILFYDRFKNMETSIVTCMSEPGFEYRKVHCHPHPQFVLDDLYIVYTITDFPYTSIAVTSVNQFL